MPDRPSASVKMADGRVVRPIVVARPNADGSIPAGIPSIVGANGGALEVQPIWTVNADGTFGTGAATNPAAGLPPTIIPAAHLKAFGRALNPVVCIIGDSTTVGGGASTVLDFLAPLLMAKIRRDNPDRTITFKNVSVGGKSWSSLTSVVTADDISGSPDMTATGLTTSAVWLDFAKYYNPDLLIINLGTNGADGTTPYRIDQAITSHASAVATWTKQPSIILVTPNPRSTINSSALQLTDRLLAAGALRSFADFRGYGYLDLHRFGSMARDGVDPVNQVLTLQRSSAAASWPITLEPTTDGEISFTIANPQDAFVAQVGSGGARQLELTMDYYSADSPSSASTSWSIRFGWGSSTRWRYQVYAQGGLTTTGIVNTGAGGVPAVALGTTPTTVRVSWKGNMLKIDIGGTEVFNGPFYRTGGIVYPRMQFVGDTTPYAFTLAEYRSSAPALTLGGVSDTDFYGTVDGLDPAGGNGQNHPASRGINSSVARVVEAANFSASAAGVPVEQAITAAGAISLMADYVRITGPTSSTYAVTLAAPGPTDIGRVKTIEMVATTSTNAVTLALTNVEGGTAATSASFDAAGEKLVLVGGATKWCVIKQQGVTLS